MALGSADDWTEAETFLMQLKGDIGTLEVFDPGQPVAGARWPAGWEPPGPGLCWPAGIYLVIRRLIPWQIPLGALIGAIGMGLVAVYTDARIAEMGFEEFGAYLNVVWFHLGAGVLHDRRLLPGPGAGFQPGDPLGRPASSAWGWA